MALDVATRVVLCDPLSAPRVAGALVSTGAYRVRFNSPRDEWFVWKSGIRAPCYCNCRDLNGSIGESGYVAEAMARIIRDDMMAIAPVDSIVGIAVAGLPWATRVAERLGLPLSYIRLEKRDHGIGGRVECPPMAGSFAVVIDDLVATGGTIQDAIDVLAREGSIRTVGFVSIVNWGSPEVLAIAERHRDLIIRSLVSYPSIIDAALERGIITSDEAQWLESFYQHLSCSEEVRA